MKLCEKAEEIIKEQKNDLIYADGFKETKLKLHISVCQVCTQTLTHDKFDQEYIDGLISNETK